MTTLTIDHIVSTPELERPHIRGTQIRVQDVAAYYKGDWNAERIADELSLYPAQVHAALAYYFDHQDGIEQDMAADIIFAKSVGRSSTEARQAIAARKK